MWIATPSSYGSFIRYTLPVFPAHGTTLPGRLRVRVHPSLAVNPTTGIIKVFWYDRRNDPQNVSVDLYQAQSVDGGASFEANARMTTAMFGVPHLYPNFDCCTSGQGCTVNVANCYMGDYIAVQGLPNSAAFYYAWGDNSLKFFDPDTNANVPDPDIRVLAGC